MCLIEFFNQILFTATSITVSIYLFVYSPPLAIVHIAGFSFSFDSFSFFFCMCSFALYKALVINASASLMWVKCLPARINIQTHETDRRIHSKRITHFFSFVLIRFLWTFLQIYLLYTFFLFARFMFQISCIRHSHVNIYQSVFFSLAQSATRNEKKTAPLTSNPQLYISVHA